MSASLVFLLLLSLVLLALWAARLFLRWDLARLGKLEAAADKYSKYAREFLGSELELPKGILDQLEFWNDKITDREMARKIVFVLARRGGRPEPPAPARPKIPAFLESNPDLERKYMSALFYGLVTVSYSSRWYGFLLRGAIADMILDDETKNNLEALTLKVRKAVIRPAKAAGCGMRSPRQL